MKVHGTDDGCPRWTDARSCEEAGGVCPTAIASSSLLLHGRWF